MPKTTAKKAATRAGRGEEVKTFLVQQRARLAELAKQINSMKVERDAFVAKNRAVYAKERAYADDIKALSQEWAEIHALVNPKPARGAKA